VEVYNLYSFFLVVVMVVGVVFAVLEYLLDDTFRLYI